MRDNKILSQAEIEALLAGTGDVEQPLADTPEADVPVKAAKVYDFRRPDKFSKEHLRALRILHESFARLLASSLTSYLSTTVQVRLTMLEQVTYDDYMQSLPTPTVIYLVGMPPLSGQAVIELNLSAARVILDRLLGGSGMLDVRTQDLTEIEMTLLKTVGGFITSSLREAWASVVPIRPQPQDPVLNREMARMAVLAESTVMLVLEISLFKTTATMSMCIPYPVIQPVMDNLISHVWLGGGGSPPTEDVRLDVQEQMSDVVLDISADLGQTEITLRDLLHLAEGQTIKLNTAADGVLPIRVGEHVKFHGRPGLSGKNLAIQIADGAP
jgi:flagellar motor switch protein FliM